MCITLGACTSPSSSDDEIGETAQTATDTDTDTDTATDSEDSEDTSDTGEPEFESYDEAGPHAVGTRSFVLADPEGERELMVQIWYPAQGGRAAGPITGFVTAEPDATSFQDLVDAAEEPCTRKQTSSAFDVMPVADREGAWPTVLFSHCHTCTRFSSYSVAERLASHGFLVAAVDHRGNTLFDQLAGDPLPVDVATLELRVSDMRRLLDELLEPTGSLPRQFVGLVDPDRVGVFGHSFGSVTTGKLLQDDDRFVAGVGIAAPFESPILPGITMAAITEPLLLLVATEDNSITEIGNNIIRGNFGMANTPVWKIEFTDAGHWSFSDICNLIPGFQPGCGEGQRQTNPDESFTYLDSQIARDLTATKVTSFFAMTLRGETEAREQLEAADPVLDIQVRE
jgi:predicted dienelactone hydrolase